MRGDWKASAGVGWQHGPIPRPPTGLMPASRAAWSTWFKAWFAAHWTKDDLPGLRIVILLYDQVQRGEYQRANELRLQMDTYGITPKGQQDRRWEQVVRWEPVAEEPEEPTVSTKELAAKPEEYQHLRVVE